MIDSHPEIADWLTFGAEAGAAELQLGPGLERFAQGFEAFKLARRLSYVRAHISSERGLLLKNLNIRSVPGLPKHGYVWSLGGRLFEGELHPDKLLAVWGSAMDAPNGVSREVSSYGTYGIWIEEKDEDEAEDATLCFQPLELLALDLTRWLRVMGHQLIDQEDVLRHSPPFLKRELEDSQLLRDVCRVVRGLEQSGFPVPLLSCVLETIVDRLAVNRSPQACVDFVRKEFNDHLCHPWVYGGQLSALTICANWARALASAPKVNAAGFTLSLLEALRKTELQDGHALLVDDSSLRRSVQEILRFRIPSFAVLSRCELPEEVSLNSTAQVAMKQNPSRAENTGKHVSKTTVSLSAMCRDQRIQYCGLERYRIRVYREWIEFFETDMSQKRPFRVAHYLSDDLDKLALYVPQELNRFIYTYQEEPIVVLVDRECIPLVDPRRGSTLLEAVSELRDFLRKQHGWTIPGVRLRDDLLLPHKTYAIGILGKVTQPVELHLDQKFVYQPHGRTDLVSGLPGIWISDTDSASESSGEAILTPEQLVVNHLHQLLVAEAHRFLGRGEVHKLLDEFKTRELRLASKFVTRFTLPTIQRVLCGLLRGGHSIKDIETIARSMLREPGTSPERLLMLARRGLETSLWPGTPPDWARSDTVDDMP